PARLVSCAYTSRISAARHGQLAGGRTDRAAFYNGALLRYLDFNDSYLAPGEPSDNLASVLATSEYAGASRAEFLTEQHIYATQPLTPRRRLPRRRGSDHRPPRASRRLPRTSLPCGPSSAAGARPLARCH